MQVCTEYVTYARFLRRGISRKKVSDGKEHYERNKEVRKDSMRDYYERNKAALNDYYREHYLRNKDNVAGSESKHDYYERNKEGKKRYSRQYHSQNREEESEHDRLYYLRHKEHPETYARRNAPIRSWKTPDDVREYFESVAALLNITEWMDWYRVSRDQMRQLDGRYLYSKFDSLGNALQYAYPEFDWDLSKFSHRGKKAEQRSLRSKIEELLPGIEVIEEHQHSDCALDGSQRPIEFDLWIPQHRIAIEYHGEHHYYNMDSAFGPNGTASLYSGRDLAKTEYCERLGITLIAIPYWWDGGMDSLSATLYQSRPDVFPTSQSRPIPSVFPVVGDRVRVSAVDTFRE